MTYRIGQAINSPVALAGVIPALVAWVATAISVASYVG